MVVVDLFSKYTYFCALLYLFTPGLVVQVFMYQIFKLHGILTSIVSDQDLTFNSNYSQEIFKLHGMQIQMSTTYHSQIDGKTKELNECLDIYLWCFTLYWKIQWLQWLPLV